MAVQVFNFDDTTVGIIHENYQVSIDTMEDFYKLYFGNIDCEYIDVCLMKEYLLQYPDVSKCRKFVVQKLDMDELLAKRILGNNIIDIASHEISDKMDGIQKNKDYCIEKGVCYAEVQDDTLYFYTDCDKIIASRLLRDIIHKSNIREYDFEMFLFLDSLNLENFFKNSVVERVDFSKVSLSLFTKFDSLFDSCENLVEVRFNDFDYCGAISATRMFYNCKNLKNLDLSAFDFSALLIDFEMFYGCNFDSLKTRHIIRGYEGKQTITYIEQEL